MRRIKSKSTCYGMVEIFEDGSVYRLYVNNQYKEYSTDLNYILSRYDAY